MPSGVPLGSSRAFGDLYGWKTGTSPTLFNNNLYQPFATLTQVQSGTATYTAYFNIPKSYPKTGETLEVPLAAGLPFLGLAVGGWFWTRQALAR